MFILLFNSNSHFAYFHLVLPEQNNGVELSRKALLALESWNIQLVQFILTRDPLRGFLSQVLRFSGQVVPLSWKQSFSEVFRSSWQTQDPRELAPLFTSISFILPQEPFGCREC